MAGAHRLLALGTEAALGEEARGDGARGGQVDLELLVRAQLPQGAVAVRTGSQRDAERAVDGSRERRGAVAEGAFPRLAARGLGVGRRPVAAKGGSLPPPSPQLLFKGGEPLFQVLDAPLEPFAVRAVAGVRLGVRAGWRRLAHRPSESQLQVRVRSSCLRAADLR